ncbi:MAG: hypothetical protein WBG86_05140 [Polyangiales bacterium]
MTFHSTRITSTIAVSMLVLAACGTETEEQPPRQLEAGSWEGPAELARCHDDTCAAGRLADQSDFEVIVHEVDATVSSSDTRIVEIVSQEPAVRELLFGSTEYLSVTIRTVAPGDAVLTIHGPSGDQRDLPVRVASVETHEFSNAVGGGAIESVGYGSQLIELRGFDADGAPVAVTADWSTNIEDQVSIRGDIFGDSAEVVEVSRFAIIAPRRENEGEGVLFVSAGSKAFMLPIDFTTR